MKWRWCVGCPIDGHCENQDRNTECACNAREQFLRAEQYGNLIDKQQKQLKIAVEVLESFAIDEFYDKNVAHKSANAVNKIKKLDHS